MPHDQRPNRARLNSDETLFRLTPTFRMTRMLGMATTRRWISLTANDVAKTGRWLAVLMYLFTAVTWPIESASTGPNIVGQGGCQSGRCGCSAAKRTSGNCCCSKRANSKTVASQPVAAKSCCSKRACCSGKVNVATTAGATKPQSQGENFGWSPCDCPGSPSSPVTVSFQPRLTPDTVSVFRPLVPQAEYFVLSPRWGGIDLDPPTPPPKVVL